MTLTDLAARVEAQNTILQDAVEEAMALINEINEFGGARRRWGINQPLHAKLCFIRGQLAIANSRALAASEASNG